MYLESLSIVMQMKKYQTLLHFVAGCLQIQNYLSSKPSTPQSQLKTKQTTKAQCLSLQWKRSGGVILGKLYHPERRLRVEGGGLLGRKILRGGGGREKTSETWIPKWLKTPPPVGGGRVVTVESKSETYSESTFLETSLFRRPHLSPLLLLECIRE